MPWTQDVTVVTLGLAFDSYCGHGGGDVCEREGQDRWVIGALTAKV